MNQPNQRKRGPNDYTFFELCDRYPVFSDIDTRNRQATELWDEVTGDRIQVETVGTTTRVKRIRAGEDRAFVLEVFKTSSRDAARNKHYSVVGRIQRQGI